MTYDPLTPPSGAQNISVTRPQITTNFTQLNTIFDNDHWKYNETVSARRGYHRQITYPVPLTVDPATSTNTGSLYTKADVNDTSARPQLYFQNINGVNNVWQITNRFHNSISNNGYWVFSNGTLGDKSLIAMWGNVPAATSSIPAIAFPTISNYVGAPIGFPNSCFGVFLSQFGNSATTAPKIIVDTFGTQQFTVKISAGVAGTVLYWFAVGN